jgi:hypothetical protein
MSPSTTKGKGMAAKTNGSMSAKDRAALRSIIRERFKILGMEVARREREVKHELRERVLAEYEDALEEGRNLLEEMRAMQREFDKRSREIETHLRKLKVSTTWPNFSVSVPKDVEPKGLDDEVNRRIGKLSGHAGRARNDLQLRELDLLERLAVGGLESDEARVFLAEVPTVDDILPMPNGKSQKRLARA